MKIVPSRAAFVRRSLSVLVMVSSLAACGPLERRTRRSDTAPAPHDDQLAPQPPAPTAAPAPGADGNGVEPESAARKPAGSPAERRPRAAGSAATDPMRETSVLESGVDARADLPAMPSPESSAADGAERAKVSDRSDGVPPGGATTAVRSLAPARAGSGALGEAGGAEATIVSTQPSGEGGADEATGTVGPGVSAPSDDGAALESASATAVRPQPAASADVELPLPAGETPDGDSTRVAPAGDGEAPGFATAEPTAASGEGEAGRDARPVPSAPPQPIDFTGTFWLGDGYDALSGARRASCLDNASLELRSYPVNQAYDTLELVVNREELSRKLDLEANAEASGAWSGFTATPSVKVSILRETSITSSSFVALARFRFLKSRISLYQSIVPLAPDRLADLAADKERFREECGDKFTRSVRMGAELILVITAQQIRDTRHSATQVTQALKVGFGAAFSVNQSSALTREQREILDNFYVSTRCYTNGASALPCVDNGLNIAGASFGDATILERINGAKRSLAAEISAGDNLVVLDEELESYPMPAAARGRPPEEVFVDYSTQLRSIQAWLRLESRVELICDSLPDMESACYDARRTLADAIDACADYRLWPRGLCRPPQESDLAFIQAQADAGSITVFEHGGGRGRRLTLDFHDVLDRDAPLKPGVLYDLGDQRFGWFVDIASSADTYIRNGWQLVFFEHPDGSGRAWSVGPAEQGYVNVGPGFNDKASAFRLVRLGH